jgi:hypothetical protein
MHGNAEPHYKLSVQDRDLALLRGLFESRVMTAEHIATIYFDGRSEAGKKRLQKLKAAGFVGERTRRAFQPSVLFLTRKGLSVLKGNGVLAEYPSFDMPALEKRARVSEQTLRHELEVMDVKAAFHAALKKSPTFSVVEFSTWPHLNQFDTVGPEIGGGDVTVKPDGFIRVHEKEPDGGLSEHTFFLEVDRSSETLDTLVSKTCCYLAHYKSGGFAVRNGAPRSAYKDYPFRVLMLFKTAERRNNLTERLLQNNPPIFTLVHLSTLEQAETDPLGAVWIRPLDYRDAAKGTPFAPGQRRVEWGYQRQTARDLFVERQIQKRSILAKNSQ